MVKCIHNNYNRMYTITSQMYTIMPKCTQVLPNAASDSSLSFRFESEAPGLNLKFWLRSEVPGFKRRLRGVSSGAASRCQVLTAALLKLLSAVLTDDVH